MNTEKTLFEKIVAGEIPSYKIYEDENTFAFLDISPNNPGHTLVIPKSPIKDIYEMDDETIKNLFVSVKKVSNAIKKALRADGIKIKMHNGTAAGQVVFHAHVHVIPKFDNNEYSTRYEYKEGEAAEIASKIRSEFSS